MPNRERSGAVINPARVVAPIKVKCPRLERMNARAWPLPDNQVHAKIFHRGIQHFFDRRLQAVNLIEEKNLFFLERSQNRGEIALAFQQRPRAGLDRNIQFIRDNLRERGFAQSRRAIQKHVVQRFAPAARRVDRNLNIFFDAFLSDVFVEAFRAHAHVNARVFLKRLPGNNALRLPLLHHPFCGCIRHGYADLAARPFGALKECKAPRRSFSKFAAPASRFASPTAASAARAS